ncbi:MAG: sulfurtransferase [Flavobacteriaceae bacterium]|nr:sulfurtransferase [Flavobacteriaceae bacterium]
MSNLLQINKPLVSVNWLYKHLNATNLVVLNGTLPKVTAAKSVEKTEENQILNTRFFDLKNVFSVQGAAFPNTVLQAKDFEKQAQKLGIERDSCIIVYDEHGVYSAPRVWWLFKTFGFDNIAVLNGGFPAWKNKNYPTEKKEQKKYLVGNFIANKQENLLIDTEKVLQALDKATIQIVDARSTGRFNATAPEPRKEVRSGHIPSSKNLPYANLVSEGKMKSVKELKALFKEVNFNNKEMIFSCGSGITACVLALGASTVGYDKLSVYDGSWTEWGSLAHVPIEK